LRLYSLRRRQRLSLSTREAWAFFSDPRNLALLTPPGLGLEVEGEPEPMYEGQILTYRIRPFPGVRSGWVTEITHVRDGESFVDEQRMGPYRFWHHQHRLRAVEGGTEVEDLVHYALPLDPLSRVAHATVVAPRLESIFEFRRRALAERFGTPGGPGAVDGAARPS